MHVYFGCMRMYHAATQRGEEWLVISMNEFVILMDEFQGIASLACSFDE